MDLSCLEEDILFVESYLHLSFFNISCKNYRSATKSTTYSTARAHVCEKQSCPCAWL